MRRIDPDGWAGITSLVVLIGTGVVVAFVATDDSLAIPLWAWVAGFAVFVATLAVTFSDASRRVQVISLAVQVGTAYALVLTGAQVGWLPILLVFVAAMSTYVVAWQVSVAIIAANTAVIALATSWSVDETTPVLITAAMYLLIQLATVFSSLALTREQALRARLTEAHNELHAAAVLRDEATRADERLRIARELHDVVGHQLTALTLELEAASHREGPRAAEHVDRAKSVARELLSDVRGTVGELRRRAPDLRETLNGIAARVPEPRVEITVDDAVEPGEDQTVALVRVVQEIVTNTIRHAGASVLRIHIGAEHGGGISLSAHDDGHGVGQVEPGNGLRGIEERIEALDGAVRFDGSSGFRVDARVTA